MFNCYVFTFNDMTTIEKSLNTYYMSKIRRGGKVDLLSNYATKLIFFSVNNIDHLLLLF